MPDLINNFGHRYLANGWSRYRLEQSINALSAKHAMLHREMRRDIDHWRRASAEIVQDELRECWHRRWALFEMYTNFDRLYENDCRALAERALALQENR